MKVQRENVWARRFLVLAAAATAAVVGAASGARADPAADANAHAAGIVWGACTDQGLIAAGAQCGFLSVPLDYDRPGGRKIQLAVSRVRHTTPDAQFQGVMLVNPGGPGGSGLGLATLGQAVPNHAGDAYDWIGFDPRGVGASRPALSCIPNYFSPNRPDYIPSTRALERTWLDRSEAYADACDANAGALLDNLTTVDSARDMDRIRQALGQRQINYYGFSYGTYLGQVYSTLYPERMRRMVLDSNVNPHRVWYQANLDQDIAFEAVEKLWFAWLAQYDSVYGLGTTEQAVERLWYATQDKLRAEPAGGVVGPDEFTDIFLLAGYNEFFWPYLGSAFAGWVHNGDAQTLIGWYQAVDSPGNDNTFAVYLAVECTDAPWPRNWNTWRRDNSEVYQVARFVTWDNAWFNAPCAFWQARAGRPVDVDGRRVASALLIDETLDAPTPFEGSLVVRGLYPNSRLIAVPGGASHANSLNGNACVDNQIADYLATGKLPARRSGNRADTTCAPLPKPVPLAGSATATAGGSGAHRLTPHVQR